MRFHFHRGHGRHHGLHGQFAMPGRFGFDSGDFHFDFGEGGRFGHGHGGRRGRRRVFESGELRLTLLKLLADQPRHGYELIKAIEEMTGGDYAPSPGVVYPTLSMLEDLGYIAETASPDAKRVYAATDAGRAHLADNEAEVAALIERLGAIGKRRQAPKPEIGRAVANMMAALRNRVGRDGWTDELLGEVVDILDEAAKKIERI
ncbi:PadR family transcriptional regulator [Sphingomonas jaspsi]|uniref:PadR family transcriptional regulator n=1 Tax=Sphingomonas jaspsi TaxID=392409 RepID=UPI0004B4F54A|nr:PadR family transcriptional regulator [Sphingomonas jaspsi]